MPSQDEVRNELAARVRTIEQADDDPKAEVVAAGEITAGKGTINEMLTTPAVRDELMRALPNSLDVERFTRIVMTAVHGNERLQQCTFRSLIAACLASAQLGLEPNSPLQQAALVPYWNNQRGCWEAQMQIQYRGLIALAHRSDKVASISAHTVREADEIEIALGTEKYIRHRPHLGDEPGDSYLWYATVQYTTGAWDFVHLTRRQVEYHRSFSKQPDGLAWTRSYDAMGMKTAIIELSKFIPQAVELAKGATLDEAVIDNWSPDIATDVAATNTEPAPPDGPVDVPEEPADEPGPDESGTGDPDGDTDAPQTDDLPDNET